MGNLVSFPSTSVSASGSKIVLSDGTVRAFAEPVSVAELMMEHPRHFVVDARLLADGGGAKVAPLPADQMLAAGKVYVILPAVRGKVSADEARRVLLTSRSLGRSRSMPVLARKFRKCAEIDTGGGRQEGAVERTARPEILEDHRPEFLSRELSSRAWKPSLRTIEERVLAKKVPHWLF